MKTLRSVFASLLLAALASVPVMAQMDSKMDSKMDDKKEAEVIAVINRADWCPVCQANGKRAHMVFKENNKDGAIMFITNDLTDDATKSASMKELKKYGLDEAMAGFKKTGVIYFFNPETKDLIEKVSAAEPNEGLVAAMKDARKGIEKSN